MITILLRGNVAPRMLVATLAKFLGMDPWMALEMGATDFKLAAHACWARKFRV